MIGAILATPCCCREDGPPPNVNCCGIGGQPTYAPTTIVVRWTGNITVSATNCACGCNDDCSVCFRNDSCTAMSGTGSHGPADVALGTLETLSQGEGYGPNCAYWCRYNFEDNEVNTPFVVQYPPDNCTPIVPCPPPCTQFPPYPCVPWQPSAITRYAQARFLGVNPDETCSRWLCEVRPAFGGPGLAANTIPGPCVTRAIATGNDYGIFVGPEVRRCADTGVVLPSSMLGTYQPLGWSLVMEAGPCNGGFVSMSPGTVIISAP